MASTQLGTTSAGKPYRRALSATSKTLRLECLRLDALDLAPLAGCPELRWLRIWRSAPSGPLDLSPLAGCTKLKTLEIYAHEGLDPIDLAPLAGCTTLEKLSIYDNGTATLDLAPLAACTRLHKVHVEAATPIELAPLVRLPALEALWLNARGWSSLDLAEVAQLRALDKLTLWYGDFTALDLAPLAGHRRLRSLQLSGCTALRALDLTPLASCPRFQSLAAPTNPALEVDLTPLCGLAGMTWINVHGAARAWIGAPASRAEAERFLAGVRHEGTIALPAT